MFQRQGRSTSFILALCLACASIAFPATTAHAQSLSPEQAAQIGKACAGAKPGSAFATQCSFLDLFCLSTPGGCTAVGSGSSSPGVVDDVPATGRVEAPNSPSDASSVRKARIEITPRLSVFENLDYMHSSYANETNAPANIPANIPPNANAVTATFGLDWHARDNLHLGLAFSVTREIQNFTSTVLASGPGISTVFAPGGSSVAKYGGLLAIASWDSKDNWMINGYAGWMYGTLNISRGVTTITLVPGGDPTVPGDSFASPLFVNASPNASRLLGGLALDVSFPMGRWEWRGSVGFDAMRTSINAYEEQGISGFELAVPTHIVESDRGRLDIALARTFSTRWFVWQPEFRAGLRLEFAHDASTIGVRFIEDTRGTLINLDSAALDPDWGEADFSTVFTFKHGYSAFLRLGREFGHSTSTATFYAIGGRIEF